jgi:signal transduction histidine kinase
METRAACALHDLRHELTVSSLELDRVSTQLPPGARAGLDRVRGAIGNARALCESGLRAKDPDPPSAARVDEILRTEADAARLVSGRGESVEMEIRCDADLEFPLERESLSRIVRNLVLNALENSPEGERVRIEAERGPGAELVLRVIDRGRGMSAADRDELLRFGRSGRGGFGIGSASVAICARRIGARVEVSSRLGAGTCVEVSVPAAEGPH